MFTKDSKAVTLLSVKKPLLHISWYSILAHFPPARWESMKVVDHTIHLLCLSHVAALFFICGKGKSQGSLQWAARGAV